MASLTADPPACSVSAGGGTSIHQLTNPSGDRIVFKVKSSNNSEYRIKPVFGFIEAGAAAPLEITRLAGAPKEDRLVIYFAPASPDMLDAAAAFALSQVSGTVTIPLTAN